MTRTWVYSLVPYLVVIALLSLAVSPFAVRHYRMGKTAAFSRAVAALPARELEQFASRCDRLIWERIGTGQGLEFIDSTNILNQFRLAGENPYSIVLEKVTVQPRYFVVAVKYFKSQRYGAIIFWNDDVSQKGDPVRVLKICYGTSRSAVLYQCEGGEP